MPFDVAKYLKRIRYEGPRDPTARVLADLHEQHLRTVPFENLDIHLRRAIVTDVETFYEKIVERRRGGFCYELNGAFAELLRRLGFEVSMLSAGVHTEDHQFGPDFDHMTLLARADDALWLADVGFGDSFLRPLRMDTAEVQVDRGGEFRIATSGEERILVKNGEPEYRFTLDPRTLTDYAGMCQYHQTSPQSSFTRKRICSMATAEGRITLSDRKLIITTGGDRLERELPDEGSWREALRSHFDLELPEVS